MAITDLFDRYEFLTTIVPGAAFVAALLVLIAPAAPQDLNLTTEVLLVLAVGVFLVGEVLTMFTDTVDPGQRQFAHMLLAVEVRLELDELEDAIRHRAEALLGPEREGDEAIRETVRRLTGIPWEDTVSEWDPDQRDRWALAHALCLVFELRRIPRANDTAFVLVKNGNRDPGDWRAELEPIRDRELHRLEEGGGYEGPTDLFERFEEVYAIERNGEELPAGWATWDDRSFMLHEWQLAEWFIDRLENGERDAVERWFELDIWDDLIGWALLSELGELGDRYLQTMWSTNPSDRWSRWATPFLLDELGRMLSSAASGRSRLTDRFRSTDPVSRTDEETVSRLRAAFDLASLRERYESLYRRRWAAPEHNALPGGDVDPATIDHPNTKRALADLIDEYAGIFRTLYTLIEDHLGSQAERFRSRSVFHQNMRVTTMFIVGLYLSVTGFRFVGGVFDAARVGAEFLDDALRWLDAVLAVSTIGPGSGREMLDELQAIGFLVLPLVILLREYDLRAEGSNRPIWRSGASVGLLMLLLSLGWAEFLAAYRSVAVLWVGLVGFLLVPAAIERWLGSSDSIWRMVLLVVGLPSMFLVVSVLARVPIVAEAVSDIGTAASGLESVVLGFPLAAAGTGVAAVLWYMFSVWNRKHEQEYIRYVFATFYSVTGGAEGLSAGLERNDGIEET